LRKEIEKQLHQREIGYARLEVRLDNKIPQLIADSTIWDGDRDVVKISQQEMKQLLEMGVKRGKDWISKSILRHQGEEHNVYEIFHEEVD